MGRPIAILSVLCALALGGCQNPDAPGARTGRTTSTTSPRNAGEPAAPAPPSAGAQRPADLHSTPRAAIAAFARLYVNWSYRTLADHQRTLSAIAVGAARLSERQAAASSVNDHTIARAQVANRGELVSVAVDQRRAGWWVVVTHEQTSGGSQYEGLPAAYHITLAQLASMSGGYAVEQWLPQS